MPLRSPRLTKSLTDLAVLGPRSVSASLGRLGGASAVAGFAARRLLGLLAALGRSRRRGRGACSSRSSGVSHSPIVVFTSRSMRPISSRWAGVTKVIARPVRPTRPVRPMRWT